MNRALYFFLLIFEGKFGLFPKKWKNILKIAKFKKKKNDPRIGGPESVDGRTAQFRRRRHALYQRAFLLTASREGACYQRIPVQIREYEASLWWNHPDIDCVKAPNIQRESAGRNSIKNSGVFCRWNGKYQPEEKFAPKNDSQIARKIRRNSTRLCQSSIFLARINIHE